MSSTIVSSSHGHQHCHSCHTDHCEPKGQEKAWGFQQVLEVVCRVALTVFGMMAHPISTSIGLASGLAYGFYVGYKETHAGKEAKKGGDGGCAHGFLEELSGVRFPKALNTLAATGITLEHLVEGCGHGHGHDHHHSPIPFSIFGALAGLSFGAWSGRSLWQLSHQITSEKK